MLTRSRCARSHALMVENASSMGLKSGEYAGRNSRRAPCASTISQMPATLWIDALSMTSTELGRGHAFMHRRRPSTNRRKSAPAMAFSTTSRWRIPSREMAGRMEYFVPRNWNSYRQARSPRKDHAYGLLIVSWLKWLSSANTSCSGRKWVWMRVLNSIRSCSFRSRAGRVIYEIDVSGDETERNDDALFS
jgi:hypothetical protein